jgi:HEPN domain-containing protein
MTPDAFDPNTVASYWQTEAQEALTVADHLVEKGDYSYALFFGHLAIEKMLKSSYAIKMDGHAPPIHNLLRLAKAAGIVLNDTQKEALIKITAFNIEARYPDMKRDFRRTCTAQYTDEQMTVIKEIFEWLKSQMTS